MCAKSSRAAVRKSVTRARTGRDPTKDYASPLPTIPQRKTLAERVIMFTSECLRGV